MLLKQSKPKQEVLDFIIGEVERLRQGTFTFSEIGIPKGITRELDSYETKPANIRGALYARDMLKVELSNKPKMIYVAHMPSGLPETDVLCFDTDNQVPPGTVLDVEVMLEKIVKDKLDAIFEALDWSMSELVYFWHGKPKKMGDQMNLLDLLEGTGIG